MKMSNGGLVLPDWMLATDPKKLAITEAERVDLVRVIAKVLRGIPLHQLHSGVTAMRNALGSVCPGSVSIGEAVGVGIACSASLIGVFLDQMGKASEEQSEGHIQACAAAFEQVLRARQRAAVAERMMREKAEAAKVALPS